MGVRLGNLPMTGGILTVVFAGDGNWKVMCCSTPGQRKS
jgi:hypothetical protein